MFGIGKKKIIDPNSQEEVSKKRDTACSIIQTGLKLNQTVISILNDYDLIDRLIAKFKENTEEKLSSALAMLRLEKTPNRMIEAASIGNQLKDLYK